MPTYGYRCPQCGHQFEKFHKMSVTTLPPCPECGAITERVITGGAGVHFKGSGFYATDYKKKPKDDDGPKTKEGDAKSAEKKSDTADSTAKKKTGD